MGSSTEGGYLRCSHKLVLFEILRQRREVSVGAMRPFPKHREIAQQCFFENASRRATHAIRALIQANHKSWPRSPIFHRPQGQEWLIHHSDQSIPRCATSKQIVQHFYKAQGSQSIHLSRSPSRLLLVSGVALQPFLVALVRARDHCSLLLCRQSLAVGWQVRQTGREVNLGTQKEQRKDSDNY